MPRKYVRDGIESIRYQDLALCRWLARGVHDADSLAKCVEHYDHYLKRRRYPKSEVQFILPLCVAARQYQRCIDFYVQYWGGHNAAATRQVRGEATLAYLIAKQRVETGVEHPPIQEAITRGLSWLVARLFNEGNYIAVAQWMKDIFWNGEETRGSAHRALKRCLEFVPTT